jgi:biotin transport system substrate-specific component
MQPSLNKSFFGTISANTMLERCMEISDRQKQAPNFLIKTFSVLVGTLLITLSSYITIPLYPVPVTAQTLVVLLIGLSFGTRLSFLTLSLYLFQGAVGLPVFAGGAGGLAALFGPTGGYLFGFVAAGSLLGLLARRGFGKNFLTTIIAMLAGNAVIYLFGVSWLANFIGIENALKHGVLPFLYGDVLKIFVAAALIPVAWKFLSHPR